MAFEGSGLTNDPNVNYYSFLARKPDEGKIPNPSEMIMGSEHVYIIDSRERDLKLYPNPALYSIEFNHIFKNVTSIELKGSLLPKTEYNVNTGNMFIPFNINDFITSITIKDPGFGYENGTYGFGTLYPTLATITPPAITGGTQATITVTVSENKITNITIVNPGSGYIRGYYGGLENPSEGFYKNAQASFINKIPYDVNIKQRRKQAIINVEIGHELIAILQPGQYDFAHPNDSAPGLCREVTRALQTATQKAIQEGIITPVPLGPQTGEEYFPYSVLDADDGSCYLITTNSNASPNVQVAIQRGAPTGAYTQSLFVELLFSSEDFSDSTASTLLGYGSNIKTNKYVVTMPPAPMDQTNNTTGELVPWVASPIIGRNNYDITDSPLYIILSFGEYTSEGDRLESTNSTLDKAFATLVFDANTPDVVFRSPDDSPPGTGPSSWNTLLFKPGMLKAIKGQDFDSKVLNFGPAPLAELSGITICFRKFNGDLVDFHNRNHMLLFNIKCNDLNTGNRW